MMKPLIHQALHGYSDGHRLISSSLSLSPADARTMIAMSDLSGPDVKPDPSGYITGYPLVDGGKYVLARTWAASEMPRPGCVWTHSLIIDNADLAKLTSADDLLATFRRPKDLSSKSEYANPAVINVSTSKSLADIDDRARSIINVLYSVPAKKVVAEAGHAENDARLCAAIWMQQWPRLRRSFAFCTLTGADRSIKGVVLDLQLVRLASRKVQAKFSNAVTPTEAVIEPAYEPLVSDLTGENHTQIREFLRRTGGDVDGGRRAMLPLCLLHSSLSDEGRPDLLGAVEALKKLDSFGSRPARYVRALVASKAIERIDNLDDTVFEFVLETLESETRRKEWDPPLEGLGIALWHRSPERFLAAIDAGGLVGNTCKNELDSIPALELVKGLLGTPAAAERIVEMRPELLERADFWSIQGVDESLAGKIDKDVAQRVAVALLKAGKTGPAALIIDRADPADLAIALDRANGGPAVDFWVEELVRNPTKVEAVLRSGRISRRSLIVKLARAVRPDWLPNSGIKDPWLAAAQSAHRRIENQDEDYLAAFLMARALSSKSGAQANLMRYAYSRLHHAMHDKRLADDAKNLIFRQLEGQSGWFAGDDCARLIRTVVKVFVDHNLSLEEFISLADEDELETALIREAARTKSGRRFLSQSTKPKMRKNTKKPT